MCGRELIAPRPDNQRPSPGLGWSGFAKALTKDARASAPVWNSYNCAEVILQRRTKPPAMNLVDVVLNILDMPLNLNHQKVVTVATAPMNDDVGTLPVQIGL